MIKFEFRHRPDPKESIDQRHSKLMATIDTLGEEWAIDLRVPVRAPEIGSELSAFVSLPIANESVRTASVEYLLRKDSYLLDAAEFDDLLLIEMSGNIVIGFDELEEFFIRYTSWFDSYRSRAVYSSDLQVRDWRDICKLVRSTGIDVEGRDSVYRFAPLNFFDRELCLRAFSRTPEELTKIANEGGLTAQLRNDGLFLKASLPEPLSESGLIDLDRHIKSVMGDPISATA